MFEGQINLRCPHCDGALVSLTLPEETGWGQEPQWVCFNSDCSYYREGWSWMWDQYKVKASYRYRVVDPLTGFASPLPVWSDTALCDRINTEEVSP